MPNLHQAKPIHCDDLRSVWGAWMIELANDIAAVNILEHIDEAQHGRIPDAEAYFILNDAGVVSWWSPA